MRTLIERVETGPAPDEQIEKCTEVYDLIFSSRGGSRELENVDAPLETSVDGDSASVRVDDWDLDFSLVRSEGDWYLYGIEG